MQVLARASLAVRFFLRKLARASLAVRFLVHVGSCKLGGDINYRTRWLVQVCLCDLSCKLARASLAVRQILVQVGSCKFVCAIRLVFFPEEPFATLPGKKKKVSAILRSPHIWVCLSSAYTCFLTGKPFGGTACFEGMQETIFTSGPFRGEIREECVSDIRRSIHGSFCDLGEELARVFFEGISFFGLVCFFQKTNGNPNPFLGSKSYFDTCGFECEARG